jgi:hypothetical protein
VEISAEFRMEDFDIDEIKEDETVLQHLIAGAIAGTAEHCVMFPVDTVKVSLYKKVSFNIHFDRHLCKVH